MRNLQADAQIEALYFIQTGTDENNSVIRIFQPSSIVEAEISEMGFGTFLSILRPEDNIDYR